MQYSNARSILLAAIAEERQAAGKSQERMAGELHVSRAAYGLYETGQRDWPSGVLERAVAIIGSPRLRVLACTTCGTGVLAGMPWLDRIDRHPVVQRDVFVHEAEEAQASLGALRLVNKLTPGDLDAGDRRAVLEAAVELEDVLVAAVTLKCELARRFGVALLDEARRLHNQKLIDRGYWSARGAAAAAARARQSA